MTFRHLPIVLVLLSACASRPPAPPLGLDHILIFVSKDAPERLALEKAGFRLAPGVNRHDGQGTASVTFEFENSFLELIWPDETVRVDPGLERALEKFKLRSQWRTTGLSPIAFALHRNRPGAPLPVPSWSSSPAWMAPGTSIEFLTPRDDRASPSVSVHPGGVSERPELDVSRRDLRAAGAMTHPIGVHRITAVRLISPPGYQPIEALSWLKNNGILTLDSGSEWAVELTFDAQSQGKGRDFRPELPLSIRY